MIGDRRGTSDSGRSERGEQRRQVRAKEMTEFEAAMLTLQRSALHVAIAQVISNLLVGLIQAGVLLYGIRAMTRASDQRERDHQRRHAEAMQSDSERHVEAMAAVAAERRALEALIERTAPASSATR